MNRRIVSTGSFWLTGSSRLIGPTWFTERRWYRIYVTAIRKYHFCELPSFIHSDWYIDWRVRIFGIIIFQIVLQFYLSVCLLYSYNDVWIQFNDNLYSYILIITLSFTSISKFTLSKSLLQARDSNGCVYVYATT